MTHKIEAVCDAIEAELSIANQTKAAWPNAKAHMLRQQMLAEFRREAEKSQIPWIIAFVGACITAAVVYWGIEFRGNAAALWAAEIVRLGAIAGVFWLGLIFGRGYVFRELQKKYRAFIDF